MKTVRQHDPHHRRRVRDRRGARASLPRSGQHRHRRGSPGEALERVMTGRPGLHALPLDIADAGDIAAFARRVVAEHPALNVVINNAGIMRFEALDRTRDLSDAEATITTNLLGPIRLTDALIEHLKGRPDAALINVSSGLAFVPLTATPTYSATKAALHSYTVSLREVLKGKVEVIELVPPAVQTDFTPGQATRDGYLPLGRLHRRGHGAVPAGADPGRDPGPACRLSAPCGSRAPLRRRRGDRERGRP